MGSFAFCFKSTAIHARVAAVAAILLGSGVADASEFYAYYTRLAYPDASEVALPGRALTGKYADVVVQLATGRFVFSREKSYLPYWEVGASKWPAPEIIARVGDGPPTRPDNINRASYVRIVESNATQIVVHWHYAPDLTNNHFTNFQASYNGSPSSYCQDYVEEYFTIRSDATVTRTVRSSQEKIDAYDSPSNLTVQTFSLSASGIANVNTQPAVPQDTAPAATSGAPIKIPPVASPALWWKFDDGMSTRPLARKYLAQENVTASDCIISGNAAIWQQGVSGTCLAFDGYTSVVTLPAARAPDVSGGVTMEAWVAPQEYANSSAAIVDHSGGNANGYSLHMDFLGHLVFRVQSPSGWKTLTTSAQLPLLKWAHVAAVYDPASGLKLYINGTSAGTLTATGTLVDAAATDIRIGMSHKKEAPSATVRGFAQSFLSNVVFDGLIDEVRIYGRPLSGSEIASNRTALIPANAQPLQYRVMPSGTPDGTFGARYEKLAYTPAWDNLWRVGDHPDIVVGFDQHPVRMVFWRGTGYGLSTVSENGIWVSDQSPENWTEGPSYAEHMSDKHCRFSHVRLIENTPARVLVHWRVASNMIDYKLLTPNDSWGDWTDEYYAIYPDGVAVRYQEVRGNTPGRLGEVIQHEMLNQPGTRPEDNANDQMIVVANLAGQTRRYDWSGGTGSVSLDPAISNGNIEYMNLKANYKHYIIGEVGSTWSPFGLWNPNYAKFSCWNHWPVSLVPDDHRDTRWPDRPSSVCVGNLFPVRRNVGTYQQQVMNLYGLTNRTAAELAPLAKSWAQAPPIQTLADCQGAAYVPAERAYHLTSTGAAPSVRIAASDASPLANLCLVVKDWIPNADAPARLMIDGVAQSPGPNFRQGIVRDTAGKQMLVVWVERSATTPVTLTLLTKPATPTGLIATPGLAAVALNWAPSSGATGYKLWSRNTISGAEQIETLVAPPQRSAGLTIGTPYEFKVAATSSSGDSDWSVAVTATPTATQGSQAITFDLGSALSKERSSAPFANPATASSGLAVTYSSGNPTVATVDSATGMVTITGVGTANLLANQAGDAAFAAAPQTSQTLTVIKASQTITFDLGLTLRKALVDPPFANSATASSGLAVTYSCDNSAVATVDSATGVVTIKAIGTAQILANQAGNANYQPATQVSQTLAVNAINAASTYSNTRIPFINTDTLIGAAVFGNSGTYDGIPFGLWNTPYSAARSLGSGVSMVASASLDSTIALGGTEQYATVTYSSSNAAVSLTLNGLDATQAYRIQYGFCDTRIGAFPYNTDAILTLSDARSTTIPLAIGAVTTADDYALLTTTISGSTSLGLNLPRAASGTGPIIAGFAVHRINAAIVAPNSTPDSLSIPKNSTATLSLGDFGTYSDPSGLPLAAVGISTLPLSGSLQFDTTGTGNWANVTLNQEISAATISAGRLRFTPATNSTGSPYATIEFKVGNGTLFSAPYLLTITVTDTASITAATFNASTRIPFLDSGTLVGAAVFGGAATFDSIAFSLWNTPFTTPLSLGSGVSVTLAVTGGSGGGGVTGTAFGTSQQYQFGVYPNSTPRGMTLTFTGLDSRREYRFQFGYGDTRTIYAYNETVSLTTSDSTSATTPLAFGSAASGDEYAMLTATARNTTSLVLTLPQTVSGNHGPMQAGFCIHQLPSSNYNAWAAVNTSGQSPDIDHDNDGLPNGIEYFMGATGSTHTATPAIVNTGGVLTWTWPYDPTAVTTYQLQFSDDLMNWPTVAPSAKRVLASPDRIEFTLPSGTNKKFFRLVVTPTP